MTPATHCYGIVKERIAISGDPVGPLDGWVLTVGQMNVKGERQISFGDTGGWTSHPSLLLDAPLVQVLSRGPSGNLGYYNAYNALKAVKDILLGIQPRVAPPAPDEVPTPVAIDTPLPTRDWIVGINVMSDIGYLGQDTETNDKHLFSMNLFMYIEPAQPAYGSNRVVIPGDNPQALLS